MKKRPVLAHLSSFQWEEMKARFGQSGKLVNKKCQKNTQFFT